jgi:cytochrome c-type biogenesis protein CcmF
MGLSLAAWLFVGSLSELASRVGLGRAPIGDSLRRLSHLPRAALGMTLAHAGFAVAIAGMTASSVWKQENILVMRLGETTAIAGYQVRLDAVEPLRGPNYEGLRGRLTVTADSHFVTMLHPERRQYPVEGSDTTEAAIRTTLMGDIYAVIGDPQDGGIVVRLFFEPLVHWIWTGVLLMAAGGLVSLSDRRLRIGAPARRRAAVTTGLSPGAAE